MPQIAQALGIDEKTVCKWLKHFAEPKEELEDVTTFPPEA